MKNSFLSTANRHQIKWFLALNIISCTAILALAGDKTPVLNSLGSFAGFQLLYIVLIFKQFFIGSGFFSLAANETGEIADNLIFACYGFIFPALGAKAIGADWTVNSLVFLFVISYLAPVIHGFLYQNLLQKGSQ